MKICILSMGRTGSTSLYKTISQHLTDDYYCISEPFNNSVIRLNKIDENQFDYICNQKNVLAKTMVQHIPNNKNINFIDEWIFTFFDKIILLDRIDTNALKESFAYFMYSKSKHWHKKQFYDMSKIPLEFIKEWEIKIEDYKKIINQLSIKYNKKIYYYEDIFLNKNIETINEIFNYIEIKPNFEIIENNILSNNNKVRLENKKLI
jgi:hypothetical protein